MTTLARKKALILRSRLPLPATRQRMQVFNVSDEEYETIREALREQPNVCMTHRNGNLELRTADAPLAPALWTSAEQQLVLQGVQWQEYELLLRALDRHHTRLTYDRGSLQLMTLSPEHEGYAHLLQLFVYVMAEEFKFPLKNLGSTTQRRQGMKRGLEADDGFYIKNWRRILGKKRIDLAIDPPPDLATEVEVTRSAVGRMPIYAKLRVPEVWRFDGEVLRVHLLNARGNYDVADHSPTFPGIPISEIARFLREGALEDDTAIVRRFRAWVKRQLTRGKSKRKPRSRRKKS